MTKHDTATPERSLLTLRVDRGSSCLLCKVIGPVWPSSGIIFHSSCVPRDKHWCYCLVLLHLFIQLASCIISHDTFFENTRQFSIHRLNPWIHHVRCFIASCSILTVWRICHVFLFSQGRVSQLEEDLNDERTSGDHLMERLDKTKEQAGSLPHSPFQSADIHHFPNCSVWTLDIRYHQKHILGRVLRFQTLTLRQPLNHEWTARTSSTSLPLRCRHQSLASSACLWSRPPFIRAMWRGLIDTKHSAKTKEAAHYCEQLFTLPPPGLWLLLERKIVFTSDRAAQTSISWVKLNTFTLTWTCFSTDAVLFNNVGFSVSMNNSLHKIQAHVKSMVKHLHK